MSNHMDMSNHKVWRICRIFEAPILYGYPRLRAGGHGGGGGGSGTPRIRCAVACGHPLRCAAGRGSASAAAEGFFFLMV